jgi:hypothetical protein
MDATHLLTDIAVGYQLPNNFRRRLAGAHFQLLSPQILDGIETSANDVFPVSGILYPRSTAFIFLVFSHSAND